MQNNLAGLEIRVHGTAPSVESFVQTDPALAAQILKGVRPTRLFANGKIVIAGEYSLTAFVASRITRIDFINKGFACWKFPPDISDIIEQSEEEFRQKAGLDDPASLEKREQSRATGDFAMHFVDVEMLGGQRTFLTMEVLVGLPAERLNGIHFLLSSPTLHFRLVSGGMGVLNLANMVRFTSYPGPDRSPADSWPAHHIVNK